MSRKSNANFRGKGSKEADRAAMESYINSLTEKDAKDLLIRILYHDAGVAEIISEDFNEKQGPSDAGKALEELELIWSSNVADNDFAYDPDRYSEKLFSLMRKHIPGMIEAKRFKDANEILAGVYRKTDVWYDDDLYCDEMGAVVKVKHFFTW